MNNDLKARAYALAAEVKAKMADTSLTVAQKSAFLDKADRENEALAAEAKSYDQAAGYRFMADAFPAGFEPSTKGVFRKNNAPGLNLDQAALQELHSSLVHRKSFRAEMKAPTDLTSQLPPQLVPNVIGFRHEPARILNHIPTGPMNAPSIEYLRHVSTTGAAATVAAGTLKPAVTMNVDQVLARASKIAATTSIVDENMYDFPQFVNYMGAELERIVIDTENDQILNGGGLGTDVLGIRNLTGTLVRVLGTDSELDAIEQGIADLRTGPAFAECDTIICHPTTFSKLRRTKDTQGRYLLNPDPSVLEAENLWGIPVVNTTTCPVGEVVLMDATLAAMAHIRQALSVEMSPYSGDNFTMNLTTFRVEERLALALPRPAAICRVTGL